MAMSNRERIRKGIDELKAGLIPFIEREFKAKLGAHWAKELTDRNNRLEREGGDPVVELQTNFGGGKTHSMLALYHLFSGTEASSLEGIEPILQAAGVTSAPKAYRAVPWVRPCPLAT